METEAMRRRPRWRRARAVSRPAVLLALLLALLAAAEGLAAEPVVPPWEALGAGRSRPLVAVLPVHDLSAREHPDAWIEDLLRDGIEGLGARTVFRGTLEDFLRRHRIRWTGGVGRRSGGLLREELGVDAVLVTSVDSYDDGRPPRVALTCRLVTAGDFPRILWMDSAHLAGDGSPGVLGLGRIEELGTLAERAVDLLLDSLARRLDGRELLRPPWQSKGRFAPRRSTGSPEALVAGSPWPRVAVLPFLNASETTHAGDILMLQTVRHLSVGRTIDLVEPGLVRDALLQARVIQEGGLSLAQADALRALLQVELVVTGRVDEYLEPAGGFRGALVGFSLRVLETSSRQAVWSSVSYNRGDENVVFFGAGTIPTAHELAFETSRAAVRRLTRWRGRSVTREREALARAGLSSP